MTARIDLGDLGVVLLDDEDLARVGDRRIRINGQGYPVFSTNGTAAIYLHWFVMGGTRRGHHIDHINGNKLDNRRANLRFVSSQANQVNRKRLNRNNQSGHRGVHRGPSARSPWQAGIHVNRRHIHLGSFATLEAAIAARRAAERTYYGEECPR